MQIKQTGQPIPVSKVETDRREEVSKIKPIGSQKIPDSFETGKTSSSDQQSNSSASAEPEKKAGQTTGRILINQLTQARLGDAGIKLANPSATENTGTRDLTDIQQGQAEPTSPQVNTKGNPRTPGATTDYGPRVPEGAYTGDARSNMEKNKGALADFFAQQNIDVPSSGNGVDASDFGVGAGVDLGNGFNTGQTGPGDPMDNVNDQFARRDYLNGVGNAGNRLSSQMQDALQGSDGANMGFGKDMISDKQTGGAGYPGMVQVDDEGVKGGSTTAAKDNPGLNNAVDQTYVSGPHGSAREWAFMSSQDGVNPNDYTTKDGYRVQTGKDETKIITAPDGTKTVVKPDGTTTTVSPDGSTTTKNKDGKTTDSTPPLEEPKKGGTKTAQDTTQENYDWGKVKQADELLKNLGGDGIWNYQRGPKNQGKGPDYGPESGPVGVSQEDANGSLLSQFGKEGLVGQPNQQNHDGAGPSNFGGLPGSTNSDPLEGSNYNGVTRDEEVDVSVQTGIKENVDEDDEEKRKLIRNPDFKPATNYSQFKK